MVIVRYSSSATMSPEPTVQSLPLHSASSLRPLALQAMPKSGRIQRDSSSTTPGSSQSCYTESEAASTAPSSPRTPRRRSELAELEFYALPLDTAHYKPSAQMYSSPGLLGPLQPEQQNAPLPGPAQLLGSSGRTPCSSPSLEDQHGRRHSSTVVSVAERATGGSDLDQSTDPIAAEALSRLSLSGTLHPKPRHRVYDGGRLSRRSSPLSSIVHQPSRFTRRESYSSQPSEYDHYHLLRHVVGGYVKKERHPLSPLHRDVSSCGGRKHKNQGHCNKPYPWEQTCWIRYQLEDLKKPWNVVEELFEITFTDPDFERTRQGLQGSFYRQNKALPHLEQESERYIGLPNGHIALEVVKKRDQKLRREGFFNFVNLYPEWAVIYPWVSQEHRQDALRLRIGQRTRDRETIKQKAIDAGTYVEKLGKDECSCCAPMKWIAKDEANQRTRSTTPPRRQSRL
ncbi:hypothetical protein PG994_012289 [Apiospora phragmitis]|uniref:Uncharacterized protein n=1 Tax=Apiospora phragmitis TaxID=2905665 RepID=A0ABR1TV78_9PEZI